MVLTASETRKQARESLKGKWGTVVLITLIYLAYSFIVGLLSSIPFLGTIIFIASIVIDIPILYGFMMAMIKLKRGENVGYFDFFKDGFANFKRAWCVTGRMLLKMIAPIIVIIVALVVLLVTLVASVATAIAFGNSDGIITAIFGAGALAIIAFIVIIAAYVWLFIKSLTYALCTYIAIDNQNMSATDSVNQSKTLMYGYKGRLFCLFLSFIGWWFLAAILSLIPLVPYMQFASIIFYENRAGIDSSATVAEGTVSSDNIEENKTTAKEIKEQSGSQDVKAEIVDIPNLDQDKDE